MLHRVDSLGVRAGQRGTVISMPDSARDGRCISGAGETRPAGRPDRMIEIRTCDGHARGSRVYEVIRATRNPGTRRSCPPVANTRYWRISPYPVRAGLPRR